MRVAVLVSGRGSNLQALLDADLGAAKVVLVLSNVEGAFALERAQKAGVATEVLSHKGFAGRAQFDAALVERLRAHRIDLVCLAGFMRIVSPVLLDAFPQRVLNIHPSLLPSFPGMHGARDAVAHGARFSGCTVHFVDAGTDSGPILVQAVVPVLPGDDEAALAARILIAEHRIYPEAVRLVASGRVRVEGRTVHVDGAAFPAPEPVISPLPSPAPTR